MLETERLPFFVYGTLRAGEGNWERYLKGRTIAQIPARLPAHKMYVDMYPFITNATDGSQVIGELVYVEEENYRPVLKDLDKLEGYEAATDSGWYLRVVREVELTDEAGQSNRVRAWVYHGGPEVISGMDESQRVRDGDWLNYAKRVRE